MENKEQEKRSTLPLSLSAFTNLVLSTLLSSSFCGTLLNNIIILGAHLVSHFFATKKHTYHLMKRIYRKIVVSYTKWKGESFYPENVCRSIIISEEKRSGKNTNVWAAVELHFLLLSAGIHISNHIGWIQMTRNISIYAIISLLKV